MFAPPDTESLTQCKKRCGRLVETRGHHHCCKKCRLGIGHGRRCDKYEAARHDSERRTGRMQDPLVMTRGALPHNISHLIFQGTVLGPSQGSRQGAAESREPSTFGRHSSGDGRSRSRSCSRPGGMCSICRDPLGGQLVLLPCRHIFHMECAQRWGRNGQGCALCPLCREPYIATRDELRNMRVYHG